MQTRRTIVAVTWIQKDRLRVFFFSFLVVFLLSLGYRDEGLRTPESLCRTEISARLLRASAKQSKSDPSNEHLKLWTRDP